MTYTTLSTRCETIMGSITGPTGGVSITTKSKDSLQVVQKRFHPFGTEQICWILGLASRRKNPDFGILVEFDEFARVATKQRVDETVSFGMPKNRDAEE